MGANVWDGFLAIFTDYPRIAVHARRESLAAQP
jgi:hypothetical protein